MALRVIAIHDKSHGTVPKAFVNVGISIFRNSNLGERIGGGGGGGRGQQDYLHFQKKRIWLKKGINSVEADHEFPDF